jgi:hypothetical protein
MGYLINDNLIWIMNPKCASNSIESALLNSNLKLRRFNEHFKKDRHIHASLNQCLNVFGKKESVCINRNWFEKWLSALNFIWDNIEAHKEFTPICKWKDINNEVIYNIFDNEFINILYSLEEDSTKKCFLKLLKSDTTYNIDVHERIFGIVGTLIPDTYWKSNQKCTHEFDIRELDKFVKFIEDKFGEKLIIEKKNTSTKRLNNIIVNDELKSFVWEKFEKRFEKRNQLI